MHLLKDMINIIKLKLKIIIYILSKPVIKFIKFGFITRLIVSFNNKKKDNKTKVFVLGIPRSGTSFLTGALTLLGYNLGPKLWIKKPDQYNIHGYFECIPIMETNLKILNKEGINFFDSDKDDIEIKKDNPRIQKEIKFIKNIIASANINIIKDNHLINLIPLYSQLFPDSKWIFIKRDIKETYKSNFGKYVSYDDYEKYVKNNLMYWEKSKKYIDFMEVSYEEFKDKIEQTTQKIINYLGVDCSEKEIKQFQEFYKPRV
jgi:hypothetical protein